jgi:hypothetical protein
MMRSWDWKKVVGRIPLARKWYGETGGKIQAEGEMTLEVILMRLEMTAGRRSVVVVMVIGRTPLRK